MKGAFIMKYCSTIILRLIVFASGAIMLAICAICFGAIWKATKTPPSSNLETLLFVLFAGTCLVAVPFFIALYQSLKILRYIDTKQAFSELSAKALNIITRSALAGFIIFSLCGLPCAYIFAELDDAPGLVLVGMTLAGAAFVIFVFTSVLNRLLQDAIVMKTENELTI
jgi:hypothetical protein